MEPSCGSVLLDYGFQIGCTNYTSLACMRFSVNASLYHPLVSSVFIILAILFYSVIFLFLHFLDDR